MLRQAAKTYSVATSCIQQQIQLVKMQHVDNLVEANSVIPCEDNSLGHSVIASVPQHLVEMKQLNYR